MTEVEADFYELWGYRALYALCLLIAGIWYVGYVRPHDQFNYAVIDCAAGQSPTEQIIRDCMRSVSHSH